MVIAAQFEQLVHTIHAHAVLEKRSAIELSSRHLNKAAV
jgi:hypothetical protein